MKKYLLFMLIFLASCTSDYVLDPPPQPGIHSDDPVWVEATVKGSSKKLAINKAWRNAMLEFVKSNMSADLYNRHTGKINTYIIENWRSYALGDPESPQILQRYHNRKLQIRAHIRGELLYDIQRRLH